MVRRKYKKKDNESSSRTNVDETKKGFKSKHEFYMNIIHTKSVCASSYNRRVVYFVYLFIFGRQFKQEGKFENHNRTCMIKYDVKHLKIYFFIHEAFLLVL